MADGNDGTGGTGGTGTTGGAADETVKALTLEASKYHKRAQEAERQLEILKGKVLTDEDRTMFETLKAERADLERKKLSDQGRYDELLKQEQLKTAKAIEAREARIAALQGTVANLAGAGPLKSALAAAGVKLVDEAVLHLRERVKVVFGDDNVPRVQIVGPDGNLMLDPQGKECGPADLVKQWLASPIGQVFLPPSGDTGSGGRQGGGRERAAPRGLPF